MTLTNEALINSVVDAIAAAVLRKFELTELVGGLASLRDDLAALRVDVDQLQSDVGNMDVLRSDLDDLERKLDDVYSPEDIDDKITDAVRDALSGASLSIDL